MADERYVTIPELARLLKVSRIAVYKRVKKGQIPARKIGRIHAISQQTVVSLLENK